MSALGHPLGCLCGSCQQLAMQRLTFAQASMGQLSDNYNQWPPNRGCVHNGDGRCPNYCGLNERCKLEAVREMQGLSFRRPEHTRAMTASDLGIVDELLDEKIGMEPPRVFLPLMRKPSNPLDGTRLWDNS